MLYLVKTPWWIRKWIYPNRLWKMPGGQKKIYLSFDDGPHPIATPFVLEELKKYNAKASFFCIGKNVASHPEIYKRILTEGHAVGNHTQDHLNGGKTGDQPYFENIAKASRYIDSKLFRPPYGRLSSFQAKHAREKFDFTIVMWSVLSADFDTSITPQKCWENVKKSVTDGSIIVFHDSEKALDRMKFALTELLPYFSSKGFVFEKLPQQI
ncbi:MAG: polysaccharide deacetylase family protein [Chitinophagaceae bacterium]